MVESSRVVSSAPAASARMTRTVPSVVDRAGGGGAGKGGGSGGAIDIDRGGGGIAGSAGGQRVIADAGGGHDDGRLYGLVGVVAADDGGAEHGDGGDPREIDGDGGAGILGWGGGGIERALADGPAAGDHAGAGVDGTL